MQENTTAYQRIQRTFGRHDDLRRTMGGALDCDFRRLVPILDRAVARLRMIAHDPEAFPREAERARAAVRSAEDFLRQLSEIQQDLEPRDDSEVPF